MYFCCIQALVGLIARSHWPLYVPTYSIGISNASQRMDRNLKQQVLLIEISP